MIKIIVKAGMAPARPRLRGKPKPRIPQNNNAEFNRKHPRGQPENRGQFAEKPDEAKPVKPSRADVKREQVEHPERFDTVKVAPRDVRFTHTGGELEEYHERKVRRKEKAPKPEKPKKETKPQKISRLRAEWAETVAREMKDAPAIVLPMHDPSFEDKQTKAVWDKLKSIGVTQETMQKALSDIWADAVKPQPIPTRKKVGSAREGVMETPEQASARITSWEKWYNYANAYSGKLAKKFNMHKDAVSGVIAALSPQLSWERNMLAAHDVLDVLSKDPIVTITDEIADINLEKSGGSNDFRNYKGEDPKFKHGTNFVGKFKLSELPYDLVPFVSPVYERKSDKPIHLSGDPLEKFKTAARPKENGEQTSTFYRKYKYIKAGFFTAPIINAIRIARGESVDEVLGGDKVRSFFDNIQDPDDNIVSALTDKPPVTVDVHASRILVGWNNTEKDAQKFVSASGGYDIASDMYREFAKKIGKNPKVVQAVTWMRWRQIHPPEEKRAMTKAANASRGE